MMAGPLSMFFFWIRTFLFNEELYCVPKKALGKEEVVLDSEV